MKQIQLKLWENSLLVIALAFLPVAFQLAGSALLAILYPKLSIELSLLAERLAFLGIALALFGLLKQLRLITDKIKGLLPLRNLPIYLSYALIALLILQTTISTRESISLTIFWISVNLLIGFQEELVYRQLIPKLLTFNLNSELTIAIAQSVIFAFLGHPDGQWLSNLVIRIPLALIFYAIYKRTNQLLLPTLLHCSWNLGMIYYIGG